MQEKFGPGCHFFGLGDSKDLESLKKILKNEKIACLFCEFPSNPLLKSPPLKELWELATTFGFFLIVDETVGNPVNVACLKHCDLIVSSLTKIFSGDSNVMGGSIVLNPTSPCYPLLREFFKKKYQNQVWCEDILFLERNSRTFINRIHIINENTEALCDTIKFHPKGFAH